EHIDVQGLEGVDRVEHALALHARGELHLEIDDLSAEPLRRELERDAGPRRGLGEEIRDGVPGELGALRRPLPERTDVVLRAVEQRLDESTRQALERQQMP